MSENDTNSRSQEWQERLQKVQDFASDNNRWPSTTAEVEEELKLAQWWSRQKYYHKKFKKNEKAPGITPERAKDIQDTISRFKSFERKGVWDSRFETVRDRISTTKKLWPYNTESDEEKKVLRWWNQQKTFYRKFRKGDKVGGMTENRAQNVEQILNMLNEPVLSQQPSIAQPVQSPIHDTVAASDSND